MVKGFVLDKELLKKGGRFTKDYFEELLEEIVKLDPLKEDLIRK